MLNEMSDAQLQAIVDLTEARTLNIEKDTLRQAEVQYLWDDKLEKDVLTYWKGLNKAWKDFKTTGKLPKCTCAKHENGFMALEKWNPYYFNGEPCSIELYKRFKKESK